MATISYRLDLAISLVDATTGMVVDERNALFYRNGELLTPEHREEGLYLLLNIGRENFELRAEVFGFRDFQGTVDYSLLNARTPLFTIYLIPDLGTKRGEPVLYYRDQVPGLDAIEAIALFRPRAAANSYNARKKELSVFRIDGSKDMPDVHYGLLQGQKNTYTHIVVEKDLSETAVQLAEPLEESFDSNSPIYRIVFGQIEAGGKFILAFRDVAAEIPVIIRYRKEGAWYALKTEFHQLESGSLDQASAEKEKEETERESDST